MVTRLGLDTRSKIRVCGFPEIEKFEIVIDEAEKLRYVNSIRTTDASKEYMDFLYLYGVHIRTLKFIHNTSEAQKIAKRKDKDSEIWFKLCFQLESLLKQAKGTSFYYKIQKDQPREELFFTSPEVKQGFNDLLIRFCAQELYEFEFKTKTTYGLINLELVEPENITLEIVQKKIADYHEARRQVLGEEKGQPTNANTLQSHISTYCLSYLLKIDRLLSAPITVRLNDIPHTTDDCIFIYDFLEFFDLLEYKKSNPDVTTTPQKVIGPRLNKFPSTNNPAVHSKLLNVEQAIDLYVHEVKRLQKQRIKDLGKVF